MARMWPCLLNFFPKSSKLSPSMASSEYITFLSNTASIGPNCTIILGSQFICMCFWCCSSQPLLILHLSLDMSCLNI